MHTLNLQENEAQEIYRIFPMNFFLDLLVDHELVLVKPSLWDDPFENFMLTYFKKKNIKPNQVDRWHGGRLFAQSWTSLKESDAIWRIYSPDFSGVKVKLKRSDLMKAISNVFDLKSFRDCFIGKVRYLPDARLAEIISNDAFQKNNMSNDTGSSRARSLLMKREEFSHEKEIRVICDAQNDMENISGDFLRIPIVPNSLIEEIVLDPRLKEHEFNQKKKIIRALGYKGKIEQSDLYKISEKLLR